MTGPLTVVQVVPTLGIGGVETYLCGLAEGLVRRGHRIVFLLREEGVYAGRARATGAELVTGRWTGDGAAAAAERLREFDPDLVHGHNYRAARFARDVAERLGTPYLMSVHGPRPWWKRILFRAWSDRVIVMSEGDREDVTGAFGVPRDRVVLSFYGIDTERFRPGLDTAAIRQEWGRHEGPLIVHVSRFSHRKAKPALALLRALPAVRERVPGAALVLVGDGAALGRIGERADEVNRVAGERIALVVGARTDIPTVMNAADVVITTANTAVEAMACGVPAIAFGRTGYFGRITPENLEAARAVCFADHGRPGRADDDRLVDDMVFCLTDESAARTATALREEVARRFGLEPMALHVERIYQDFLGAGSPSTGLPNAPPASRSGGDV